MRATEPQGDTVMHLDRRRALALGADRLLGKDARAERIPSPAIAALLCRAACQRALLLIGAVMFGTVGASHDQAWATRLSAGVCWLAWHGCLKWWANKEPPARVAASDTCSILRT